MAIYSREGRHGPTAARHREHTHRPPLRVSPFIRIPNPPPEKNRAMHSKGFWIFSREFTEDSRWESSNTQRVWLLLMNTASHSRRTARFDGKSITLAPGQLVTTRAEIAKKLRLQPTSVSRSLASLRVPDGPLSISIKSDGVNYLVSMLCWKSTQDFAEWKNGECAAPCELPVSVARPERDSIYSTNKELNSKGGPDRAVNGENPESGDVFTGCVAVEWSRGAVESAHARAVRADPETFDYSLEEWLAAWRELMGSRCPTTGRPFANRNRLLTDPIMALADRCDFRRRLNLNGSHRLNGSAPAGEIQPWQIARDIKQAASALSDHPGNPRAGYATPSSAELADFRDKRSEIEKRAAAAGVKID